MKLISNQIRKPNYTEPNIKGQKQEKNKFKKGPKKC